MINRMMGAISCQAGLSTNIKPPNIFHNKVTGQCLDQYLNFHITRDSNIPDILIHDFPANANGSGARSTAAIFDAKIGR